MKLPHTEMKETVMQGSCLGVWHSDAIVKNDVAGIALKRISASQMTNIKGRVLRQAR